MIRSVIGRGAAVVGAAAALTLAACGKSTPIAPTPPTVTTTTPTAPLVTMAMLVSSPSSPADGATIDLRSSPVMLIASVPAPPPGALIVDTFEFDDNASFSTPTTHAVPRSSDSTSVAVTLAATSSQINKHTYWRVRSSSGELTGEYSVTCRFRVPAETLRAPGLVSPLAGSIQPAQPRLVIDKLIHSSDPFDRSWSYVFDIAQDAEFRAIVHTAHVSETITPVLGYNVPVELPAGRYYWRVRAFDAASQSSDYSPTWSFDVDAPFAVTPQAVSPAAGASITQFARFVVQNTRVFENTTGTRNEVELSTSADFAAIAATGLDWAYNGQMTTVTITRQLAGGTYYWRARNVLLRTPTQPEISSAWTTPRPVVLIGQVLGAPLAVSPAPTATTTLRPTLTVTNVTRTLPSSAVTYRFEVSTDSAFVLAPVATGSVGEGSGSTPWTMPFDLPVGLPLWWRVQATDASTNTASPWSSIAQFAAVDSKTYLYTMAFTIPTSCGFTNRTPTFFMQSTDPPGAARPRLAALDSSTSTYEDLILDVTVAGNGTLTGTMVGGATANNVRYAVRSTDLAGKAPVTGTAAGTTMTGTVVGQVSEASFTATKGCTTEFSWSVSVRNP